MAQEALSPDLVKNRFLCFLSGNPLSLEPPTDSEEPSDSSGNWDRLPGLGFSLSGILPKTEVPGLRPRLSYVPHFPKRAGFPLNPFPPSLAYRSKLASASPLVGFLTSPTEAGEWILPTQGRRLRVSARCFYPLGQFQYYSLMGLRQGKKILNFVHISCAKIGFSSEESVGVFSRLRAHTLSTEFSTRSGHRFQRFLMKGFYKQLCDRFSRYLGFARAYFRHPLFVG